MEMGLPTTADTVIRAGDYGIAEYRMEAQDLQHLGYGTSSAKPVTISFWVKTNKTGTYVFSIFANDGNRYVSKTYTVNEANAWEYKTITFEGDTSGTINNDTGDGFRLWWWLGSGTSLYWWNYATWCLAFMESESSQTAPGLNVNMADSTSNEWFITGVQLEVGRNATEFEHRSYGEELALCQRYFGKIRDQTKNGFIMSIIVFHGAKWWMGYIPFSMRAKAYKTIIRLLTGGVRVFGASGTVSTI